MVVVPADMPVTTPVVLPTVATGMVLLLQVPPLTPSVSDAVPPEHTVLAPVIVPADALDVTVMLTSVKQPVGNE